MPGHYRMGAISLSLYASISMVLILLALNVATKLYCKLLGLCSISELLT